MAGALVPHPRVGQIAEYFRSHSDKTRLDGRNQIVRFCMAWKLRFSMTRCIQVGRGGLDCPHFVEAVTSLPLKGGSRFQGAVRHHDGGQKGIAEFLIA